MKSSATWRRPVYLRVVAVGLALLGGAGPGLGTRVAQAQTIYGPGGLLLNPTADIPKKGQLTPAVLVMPEKRDDQVGFVTWTSYNLDYGAAKNLEVGLNHLKVSPGNATAFQHGSTGLYAKYRILTATAKQPFAVAVGGGFLSGGDADARSAFAAVTYRPLSVRAKHPLRLHLGGVYVDQQDNIQRHCAVPYMGADYLLTKRWSLFGEARASMPIKADDADGTHPQRALGLIYQPGGDWKIVVGYATNGWNSSAPQFSIGIGYGLGGGR